MAQETKIVDIRRSFLPIDPNAFPPTYHATEAEDQPEPRVPIIAYDGYNFMPTPQGYASYFGVNSTLGISSLVTSGGTGNVDDLFMIQTNTFQNILVALCDDGIWTKSAASSGNWTHVITLVAPSAGFHLLWSKCVIENEIFVYRQGEASVYRANISNNFVFTGFAPTFLTMGGQLGIFKAGGRLGFWDSENSIAWSVLGDPTNFTPDPKTLAGATIFQDIVGRIVNVLQHGNGFIIYCTKSIVLVSRNVGSPLIWAGSAIFNSNGISYREEVTFAEPDTKHYAFTTQGIVEIVNGRPEFVIPEVSTYLKEKRQPVYIKIMNGRYLFFPILDPFYFLGISHFMTEAFDPIVQTFQVASFTINGFAIDAGNACHVLNSINRSQESLFIFDILGKTAFNQANATASVPIWEDHLAINIPKADIEAFKATGVGGFGSADYFDNTGFTQGSIAKIDGSGNEFFIPTKGPALTSAYPATRPIDHVANNNKDFYWRQEWLWFYERQMFDRWKEAIIRKTHGTFSTAATSYSPKPAINNVPLGSIKSSFGPFIDLSFFSETNYFYGISASRKSAWLQKSLTKSVKVEVDSILTQQATTATKLRWESDATVGLFHNSFAEAEIYHLANIVATLVTAGFTGVSANPISTQWNNYSATGQISKTYTYSTNQGNQVTGVTVEGGSPLTDTNGGPLFNIGETDIYQLNGNRVQKFSTPRFIYQDYPVCTFKNLGFTKIKGHGHYTSAGAFVVDDAIAEAADYTDQCTLSPKKRKQPFILNKPTNANSLNCGDATTVLDSVTYTYPPLSLTIPGGTILLQEGSIEPIYPTFLGAFVYDTQYKKWGKMMLNYKQLLDYLPINNVAGDAPIPYDTFLPKGAALLESGSIGLFDQFPTDSRIVFGKLGLYRKGFTDLHEVRIQNRNPLSGSVSAEGSLDGKNVEASINQTQSFADATQVTANFGLSARWFNLIVEGNYDIIAMEARTSRKGKR